MSRFVHRAHEHRVHEGWCRVPAALTTLAVTGLLLAGASSLSAQEGDVPADWRPEEHPRDVPTLEQGEPGEESHEVRRGDTLWDLAGKYLANPFRWPEIHRLNTDIVRDPHWIYPHQVLALPADGARAAGSASARRDRSSAERRTSSGATASAAPRTSGRQGVSSFGGTSVFDESPRSGDLLGELAIEDLRPSPLVTPSGFYGAGFLADPQALGPAATTARKLEGNPLGLNLPSGVKLNDRVVLSLGGLAVEVGDELQAIRWGRTIGEYGSVAHSMALLRVTEAMGDSARAVVTRLFGNYRVGDPVIAAEGVAADFPRERVPTEDRLAATVIGFEVDQPLLGIGDIIFLDAGREAGVKLGDEFSLFSRHEPDVTAARPEDRQAVARVMRVRDGTAAAMLVRIKDTGSTVGSPAQRVARAGGGP